jgi:hypothetical protein
MTRSRIASPKVGSPIISCQQGAEAVAKSLLGHVREFCAARGHDPAGDRRFRDQSQPRRGPPMGRTKGSVVLQKYGAESACAMVTRNVSRQFETSVGGTAAIAIKQDVLCYHIVIYGRFNYQ